MIGDSDYHTYVQALQILLDDPGVDAILVMNAPSAWRRPRRPPAASSTLCGKPTGRS